MMMAIDGASGVLGRGARRQPNRSRSRTGGQHFLEIVRLTTADEPGQCRG